MAAPAAPNGPACALADVLKAAGVKPSAIYTAHYGADLHLSGDASKPTLSRGVRIAKAMDPDNHDRLGDERPAVAEHPWRTGAAGHPRLARLGVAEVADAHL